MTSALRGATRLACERDDVSILAKQIEKATLTASTENVQTALQNCLRDSARRSSTRVMEYLIEQGADVTSITGMTLVDTINDTLPSLEALQLLVDRGWNINSRGLASGTPVLWFVVSDTDLVRWCLDHGADVDPPDDTPPGAKKHRKPVLEVVAAQGNIEAFELLRARGAPLDLHHGVLPSAVMSASYYVSKADQGPDTHFSRMFNMIRHLLDIGCDVNSISYGTHYGSGSLCSTPLCWLACHTNINGVRELVRLLLDRGGDPDLAGPRPDYQGVIIPSAREGAQKRHNQPFLDAVAEWEAEHHSDVVGEAG